MYRPLCTQKSVSLIASKLGRIIRFDTGTNDMCKNPWGRYSYARVLIELSADFDVLESIDVAIPLPNGKGHYMEVLDVEYEWWPFWCSKCVCFNHDDVVCPLRRKLVTKDSNSAKKDVGADRNVHSNLAGKTTDKGTKGSWGVKTKPKLVYQPVSKPATKTKNKGAKRDLGAGHVNRPTKDDSNSIGTSQDAGKSDAGPTKVVQRVSNQLEQLELGHTNVETIGEGCNFKVPLHTTIASLWEKCSHNDGASTSMTSPAFATDTCSNPITSEVANSSNMESDPLLERVTESEDEVDEVYESYDDIVNSSKKKFGSPKDFVVQGRKKK